MRVSALRALQDASTFACERGSHGFAALLHYAIGLCISVAVCFLCGYVLLLNRRGLES